MRTDSPAPRAAESVPLIDRELSSVLPAEITVPWKMPTLSLIAVTAAVVVGALVSTLAITGAVVKILPVVSMSLAVKE